MRKKFSASLVALSFVLTSSITAVAQDANYSNKNALPEIGVVASDAISLDKEMIVGDAVMRQMRGMRAWNYTGHAAGMPALVTCTDDHNPA